MTGIIRAGYTPFLISTKNSVTAICHLLRTSNSAILYISPDETISSLAKQCLENMEKPIASFLIPKFDELFTSNQADFEALPPFPVIDMDQPALIAHSSGLFFTSWFLVYFQYISYSYVIYQGSTSFPKVITITHRIFAQWALNLRKLILCSESTR